MKKIGILGGTFSPIHNGHLYIAREAYTQLGLDEIWLMPVGIPPHKQQESSVTRYDRLSMCQLAVEGISYIRVRDDEIHSDGANFTYQTLEYISEKYPEDSFYFILGEDSLRMFQSWVHPERIAAKATIVAALRSMDHEHKIRELKQLTQEYSSYYKSNFILLSTRFMDISSTRIRSFLSMPNQSTEKMEYLQNALPEGVRSYITEHHLYQMDGLEGLYDPKKEEKEMTYARIYKQIQKKLQKDLKPSRYQHTLGVAYTAASLAMTYGYPMETAYIAGLLHDCAKYMTPQELLKYCKNHKLPVTGSEKESPQLLHAKVGACKAKEDYGITREEILHAVCYHTTGCPGMSLLDKIIFTADYIEPNRCEAPRLPEIRRTAFTNLDQAVSMILFDTIQYLKETGRSMDETTQETYEYYKKEVTL